MSRELTPEEVRNQFLEHVRNVVDYWASLDNQTAKERCEGVAFSMLNIFDGSTSLPAFDIVVKPHPDDKQYCIDNDEDYMPDGVVINDCTLHELFYKTKEPK